MTNSRPRLALSYARLSSATFRWFLIAVRHPFSFLPFALLATADSVMPILPAELMALVLMCIQPDRTRAIVVSFAIAAAVSALVLWALIGQASNYVFDAYPAFSDVMEDGSVFVEQWGPFALSLLSVFPDSPRASIAAATVAGMSPTFIVSSVLVGKVVLYSAMLYVFRYLPQLIEQLNRQDSPFARRIRGKLIRIAALQRLARRNGRGRR